jgi:acetoin utilization protein AcuB
VGEVMTEAPAVLHVTHSIRAAQRLFGEKRFQHLPVVQGGRLVGILSDRDTKDFLAGRPQAADLEVSIAMTRNPIAVSPATSLAEAAGLLIENDIHCLPVVDDLGKLVGILTTSDLLRVLIDLMRKRRAADVPAHEEPVGGR